MLVSDFDYDLPTELIAIPGSTADASRMMCSTKHREDNLTNFKDILIIWKKGSPGFSMRPGLSGVFMAGGQNRRENRSASLRRKEPGTWETLVRPGRHARQRKRLFGEGLRAVVGERTEAGACYQLLVEDKQEFGISCSNMVRPLPLILSGLLKRWTGSAIRRFALALWGRLLPLLQGCILQKRSLAVER